MLVEISQTWFVPVIIWSLTAGIIIGAVYDVFRIRRYAFRETGNNSAVLKRLASADGVLCFIEDIVLSLLCAVTMILLFFKFGYGIPRWYGGAAFIAGFTLYHCTVGKFVMASAKKLLSFISAVFRLICRYTFRPVKAVLMKIIKKTFGVLDMKRKKVYTEKKERQFIKRLEEATDIQVTDGAGEGRG